MTMLRKIWLIVLIMPMACSAENNAAESAVEQSTSDSPTTVAAAPKPAAAPPAAPAASPPAGGELKASQYRELKEPQKTEDPNRIEVVEVFLYSCPHCYEFEPLVSKWKAGLPDDVQFRYMPATFGPNGEELAKAFYAAQSLNVLETMHPVLFDAIHKRGQRLDSVDKIRALFTANGVDAKAFDDAFNSFEVDSKFRLASRMQINYGITAVPAMVVNGKYRTSARLAGGGNEDALRVVNQLIAKERAAQ